MLSADLSVFDHAQPERWIQDVDYILCPNNSPPWKTPVFLVNAKRLAKFCRSRSPKVAIEELSPEVQKKAQAVLEVKKLSTAKSLTDWASFLSIVYAMFLWIKSSQVGIATIPAFDLCLMPVTLIWLSFNGVFQADMMPRSKRTVTIIAIAHNLQLLYNQVLLRWLAVTDCDSLLLVWRLLAGFIYCDHRKAAATQVIWIMLKTQTPPHVNNINELNEVWDILLWEVIRQIITIGPMWVLWFCVEHFVTQFTELMVQKADVNATLEAARSVWASQCDAEAFLGPDLRFQNPSAKMAHFFGMKTEELKDTRLVDLLDPHDAERFRRLMTNSVQNLHLNGTRGQTAPSLNLTFKHSSGSAVETRIYLSSIPSLLGDEKPGHLIAFNEIRDSIEEVAEHERKIADNDKTVIPEPPVVEGKNQQRLSALPAFEQLPLNAHTLAFHARVFDRSTPATVHESIDRVNVIFDSCSLAAKEIQVKMSTSRGHRKTLLRECIVPQAWQQFETWLEAMESTAAPAVIPFVFPKFVTGALAARHAQICRLPSNQSKSSGEAILTLRDLRMRRFQSGSGGAPTMGRGTASHVSRCSLDDQKL
eukprot:Skav215953  [mRNA]  locus=scaffold226:844484:846253:+ [translate_table: standard]